MHALSETSTTCLDTSIFLEVIETGNAKQRVMLAAQLAAFLADPETSGAEHSQVVPAVLKLAVDPIADVRRTLAEILAQAVNLHADIVFTIISDEDAIALPFLAATPALNHWHMMAVLRVGDAQRQTVIALRPDIAQEAVALAVRYSSLEACLALFENPVVKFRDTDYHSLYSRFGQDPDLAERLLAMPALPLDIRIMHTKRVSNRMHQLMAERGWVPANDAAELVADAEETAILGILVEASAEELARVIPFLVSKAMLTPSIIVRAACLGEMAVVERALAHLAGLPAQRARDLMRGDGLLGFKGLHKKSGLPQSCYGILQAACDVAAEVREEGIVLAAEQFGRRLIEALMTRYESMPLHERAKHMEFIGRFAEDRVRTIARRLKADIVRAA